MSAVFIHLDSDEDDSPMSFKRSSSNTGSHDGTPIASRKNDVERKLKRTGRGVAKAAGDDRADSEDEIPLAARISNNDSEDNEPLAVRFSRVTTRCASLSIPSYKDKPILLDNSNASAPRNPIRRPSDSDDQTTSALKNDCVDSEDEMPLAARMSNSVASKRGGISSFKDKPILPNNNNANAPRNPIKRPCGSNDQATTSLKKAKCSDGTPSASASARKDDGDDNIPLARRPAIGESSEKNPPAKNINVQKTTEVCQGSGGRKKWSTLEHNGVIFPPPYKPHGVKMLYNGQPVDLTPEQEEVATMFAVMQDTEYASKETFIANFFNDWSNILGQKHVIKKFQLCDFTPIYKWHLQEKEKKKHITLEDKKALREEKLKQEEKFMWAFVDGVKEKVGNFRVEPPGLFRGRGEHPKMGRLKRRIGPNDITINIGEGAPVPACPVPGESWKEVKHDNTVTWLAFWNDPITPKECKYVFLAASSSLKGQSDKEKYEKARKLKDHIHKIRVNYTKDFKSKDQEKKQIAVVTYLIDKLALRAGNEKDDDEADTVGCCTLKVENVTCLPPNRLQFDFLGKDSIRYLNTVEVELPVYEAIMEFCAGKNKGDHVFDKLDTVKLNAHLKDLMPGLTAKVFRTYNASITLDAILNKETEDATLFEKITVYQRANKEVAIICNHQRAVSKSHDSQIIKLNEKIEELKALRDGLKVDLEKAKKGKPLGDDKNGKRKRNLAPEVLENKISRMETRIEKMDITMKNKEDLKTVALGTSKINYLDPRITVAWCKTHEVPIEKIFSKTVLAKFCWAMDVDPDFRF